MKKIIEFKRDTNLTICVCGKGLAVFFDHGLIRFPVEKLCAASSAAQQYRVREIDESNAKLCRVNMSAEALSQYLSAGMPIRGYLFYDSQANEAVAFYWLFFQGAKEREYTIRGLGDAALISYIYVFEPYRGNRFIQTLLRHAGTVCREAGVSYLYASVRKNNLSAWKAYDRIGYEYIGRRRFIRLLGKNLPAQSIP